MPKRSPAGRRSIAGAIAATIVGLATAGCDGRSDSAAPSPAVTSTATTGAESGSDVKVLISGPTSAHMAALGGGRLEVIGGCLGAGGHVVIWPPGTTVLTKSPLRISIPGDGEYSIDDTVELGGGLVRDPTEKGLEPLKVGDVDVPESCLRDGVFLAGSWPADK